MFQLKELITDHWSSVTFVNQFGLRIGFECSNSIAFNIRQHACGKDKVFLSTLDLEEKYGESEPEYKEPKTKDYNKRAEYNRKYEKQLSDWQRQMALKYQKGNIIVVDDWENIILSNVFVNKFSFWKILWLYLHKWSNK